MSDASSDLDQLVHLVIFAANAAAVDSYRRGETGAEGTREAVRAALACALGNGLIELRPSEEWRRWISVDPPYTQSDGFPT